MSSSSIGLGAGTAKRLVSCTSAIVGPPSQPRSGCCARARTWTTSSPMRLRECSRRCATDTDLVTTSAAISSPPCATGAARVGSGSTRQQRSTSVATPTSSPVYEDPERYVEADTVARAFASLSPRWQQTLWLTEVEQRSSAEVAAHLQLAPNATAALTHRAREAFATAYLAEHIDSRRTTPVSDTPPDWRATCAINSPTASAMTWSGTSSTARVASKRSTSSAT